eukprot:242191_1
MYLSPPQNRLTSPIQNVGSTSPKDNKSNRNDETQDTEVMKPITLRSEIFEMLNFAWPVTLATIARIIMYSIDTAFLGHLGTAQLAGSALASMCANITSTFLFAPAYGLNSLCSQAIGAGNSKLAGNWLQLSLVISTLVVIPSFIILFFVRDIISPFEHDENVLKYASIFGRYACLFLVPTFIYMAIRQYFQALQIVHPATIVSILSVGVNVLLNQIFIYGCNINIFNGHIKLKFNGLGFRGSPIATACSLTFQLTIFSLYAIIYKKYPIKAGAWNGWTYKSFAWNRIKNFFKVIGPLMIGDCTENWSYQVVVLVCGTLPNADVAANTVIFTVWGVLWSVFWGIGLATIVRSGKVISNGDINGIKLIIKISSCLSIFINGIISVMCYFFRKHIAKIFTSSEDVIEILDHAIPILALLFFVGGIGWIGCGVMEGMARNAERSYVYSITAWLMFVPGSIYLAIYSKWRHQHKWSAICLIWEWALIIEIIRCILIWIILLRTDWNKQVILAKERSEALKKKENEKNKCVRTSPKTRMLIENDGMNKDEIDIYAKKLTACSMHERADNDESYDKMNIVSDRKTQNDYLSLN